MARLRGHERVGNRPEPGLASLSLDGVYHAILGLRRQLIEEDQVVPPVEEGSGIPHGLYVHVRVDPTEPVQHEDAGRVHPLDHVREGVVRVQEPRIVRLDHSPVLVVQPDPVLPVRRHLHPGLVALFKRGWKGDLALVGLVQDPRDPRLRSRLRGYDGRLAQVPVAADTAAGCKLPAMETRGGRAGLARVQLLGRSRRPRGKAGGRWHQAGSEAQAEDSKVPAHRWLAAAAAASTPR
mmetsp:Transcript_46237/g.124179  ORF Transcript_46237/g.124179 Transcript_46237/m.124179 type:complete len:237 (-) Transcript_46237:16-726(-)